MKFHIDYIILSILILNIEILTANYTRKYWESDDTNFKFLVQGGYRPTKHELAKYMVSIRIGIDNNFFGANHVCAGTIIKPDCILTAAHCIYRTRKLLFKSSEMTVVAGTVNRLKRTGTTEIIGVKKIVSNRNFDIRNLENDVAILHLKRRIHIDGETRAVMSIMDQEVVPNTICTVVGWGRLFFNGPMPAEAVYADLFAMPSPLCKFLIDKFHRPGMLCANNWSDLEQNGCQGDSGGPLFCDNKVAGIVSFGLNDQSCSGENPTVFTDVYHFRDWIIQNLTQRLQISKAVLLSSFLICWIFLRTIRCDLLFIVKIFFSS